MKATPDSTPPFKFKNAALLNRLSEMAQASYYATACQTLIQAEMVIVELERENSALRAEVKRLAAQSAPTGTAAVSWQVRRTDGSPLATWETCTQEAHDLTVATGRYCGFENGPVSEARALGVISAQSAPLAQQAAEPTYTDDLELRYAEVCEERDHLRAVLADRAAAQVEPVRMLTEEEPEKCYSLDEENFHDFGDFMDMLDEDQCKPGLLVFEGDSVRHTASHYACGAVADMFERMAEQAFDEAGEHIGDWPDHAVKGERLAELERLIFDWLDANVKVHFYTVKNVREIALTAEMIGDDAGIIPADGEVRK